MDLTSTIIPKSDQLNADDLISGPVTVTVESVSSGSGEQPVDVHLVEFPGRAYRPSKSMRRVMVAVWGKESAAYTGHRMTLYRDPAVTFGGQKVGGIKISHLSHLDKRKTLALTETKGKRAPHTVEPLTDEPTRPTPTTEPAVDLASITDMDTLRALWHAAEPGPPRARIETRMTALAATTAIPDTARPDPSDVDPTLDADWGQKS